MTEPTQRQPDPGEVEFRVTDRRPRFDGGAQAAEAPGPSSRYPSVLAEMETRAKTAESKLAEALDLLRRREADADEFRARLRREMERRSRGEVEKFLRDFLEILDGIDRGIAALSTRPGSPAAREGLEKIRDLFLSALARHGVEPMQLVDTPFDPRRAEAVAMTPAPEGTADGRIVEEIRRGYLIGEEVLRPAQVRVARASTPAASGGAPESSSTVE
jgi:molecular chaperone GrpE